MASVVFAQITDIDEFDRSSSSDKVFLRLKTSSPIKALAKFKAKFSKFITFPARWWEITNVREADRGLLWKTYIIDMELDKKVSSDSAKETIRRMLNTRVIESKDGLFVMG